MGALAIIDGDGPVYAAGALAEKVFYSVGDLRFEYKSEANEYVAANGMSKDEIERNVEPEPVAHAINIARTMLDAALGAIETEDYELYLSNLDRDNFRHTIYPEYKANRKKVVRPVHFGAIRKWMLGTGGGSITAGYEPDDELAIRAQELTVEKRPFVMVSNDKDLMQIPGTHYNWREHKFNIVSPWEGRLSLYKQILQGDSIDNIKGCPGIGPAKALAALKGCEDEACLLAKTLATYEKAKPYRNDPAAAKAAMIMNTKLVRLLTARP